MQVIKQVTPELSYGRVYVEQQTRTSCVLLLLAEESREQRDAWAPRRHDDLAPTTPAPCRRFPKGMAT
jgi:hypothetical protein